MKNNTIQSVYDKTTGKTTLVVDTNVLNEANNSKQYDLKAKKLADTIIKEKSTFPNGLCDITFEGDHADNLRKRASKNIASLIEKKEKGNSLGSTFRDENFLAPAIFSYGIFGMVSVFAYTARAEAGNGSFSEFMTGAAVYFGVPIMVAGYGVFSKYNDKTTDKKITELKRFESLLNPKEVSIQETSSAETVPKEALPYINVEIPKDGTDHKYIVGENDDGRTVIIAKPISTHVYHREIRHDVEKELGSLHDITGGYVRFDHGKYVFSGKSMDFGRADHDSVSKLVNEFVQES